MCLSSLVMACGLWFCCVGGRRRFFLCLLIGLSGSLYVLMYIYICNSVRGCWNCCWSAFALYFGVFIRGRD